MLRGVSFTLIIIKIFDPKVNLTAASEFKPSKIYHLSNAEVLADILKGLEESRNPELNKRVLTSRPCTPLMLHSAESTMRLDSSVEPSPAAVKLRASQTPSFIMNSSESEHSRDSMEEDEIQSRSSISTEISETSSCSPSLRKFFTCNKLHILIGVQQLE